MGQILKKFRRWAFNVAVTVSLLLFVTTAILYLRSYFVYDVGFVALPQFGDPLSNDSILWAAGRGGLRLEFERRGAWSNGVRQPEPRGPLWAHGTRSPPFYPVQLNPYGPDITGFSSHGFELLTYRSHMMPGSYGYGVVFERYLLAPLWAWLLPWAIVPALYWFVIRKRRHIAGRMARGECPACGYDLRAHAPGAKCPECGTPIPVP